MIVENSTTNISSYLICYVDASRMCSCPRTSEIVQLPVRHFAPHAPDRNKNDRIECFYATGVEALTF